MFSKNKLKIINDPVYGFISIPAPLVYDIIEHPWFQRLRRIRQLGLTNYTYPSAQHTRFQHALGAMHLMMEAIAVLKSKGVEVTDNEAEGLCLAILLHDIGHGPFSHTLEEIFVKNLSHEDLSEMFISSLNRQFDGALEMALAIFSKSCPKKFMHQLVSSQLDMDRLDYLARDSFFTGVAEGVINYARIIKMLTVFGDELVVEDKGIYSIEKFLISRRLMYWQVYLHKTVIAADQLLVNIMRRAKKLAATGVELFATPTLRRFLSDPPDRDAFKSDPSLLDQFARLDDVDILASIKTWCSSTDPILSMLSSNLINRRLFRVEMQALPFDPGYVEQIREETLRKFSLGEEDLPYFFLHDKIENKAYNPKHDRILIKGKSNRLTDISIASEELNHVMMPTTVSKYILYYPKEVNI